MLLMGVSVVSTSLEMSGKGFVCLLMAGNLMAGGPGEVVLGISEESSVSSNVTYLFLFLVLYRFVLRASLF